MDPNMMSSILWIGGLILVVYFLMIRPQQQRQKQQKELIESLRVGNRVLMVSGIHGKIVAIKDESFMVEIAANVQVEVQKAYIGQKAKEDGEAS